MKIYFAHSRSHDFQKEIYDPIRSSHVYKNHEIIFPHENGISINSKMTIELCDLLIAEVSFPSTGLGIEIGWANMLGKNIVCVSKE